MIASTKLTNLQHELLKYFQYEVDEAECFKNQCAEKAYQ